MLLKMLKRAIDKNDPENKLVAGDIVEVADEERAKSMIALGVAVEVTPKTLANLAEPPKEETKEEGQEMPKQEAVKKRATSTATRKRKTGAASEK